uniref:Uncharacterized protein n=1 Tax=viral metagenome TaxID=1070528 RepID=A0A6M3J991_9ZZZZ
MTLNQPTAQDVITTEGRILSDYTVEFYVWGGASYSWVDYTNKLDGTPRLSGLGSSSFQIEDRNVPNAFRSSLNEIRMLNDDGFWNNIGTLDGSLHNASEPYGASIYKRRVRVSAKILLAIGTLVTTVLFVGMVRDVLLTNDGAEAILRVISLDANARDQRIDSDKAQRHPLGSDDATSPSAWTASAPAATGNVNLYRYREKETDEETWLFGWFKNKRIQDVIERTSWALDDPASAISSEALYTEDGREVVSMRTVPPDDEAVADGLGDDRCRVVVWNSERDVLVCCVDNKIYDHDPVANTWTLRNTLTAGRQIVMGWFIDRADTNAKSKRIVLVSMDVSAYATPSTDDGILQAQCWTTTLDATGTGAYSLLDNETSLGTDIFPGVYMARLGAWNATDSVQGFGRFINLPYFPTVPDQDWGENAFLPMTQEVWGHSATNTTDGAFENENVEPNAIFDEADGALETFVSQAHTADRGFFAMILDTTSQEDFTGRWCIGQRPAFALSWGPSGGMLGFFTWDSANGFRMRFYSVYDYAIDPYVALAGASTDVPVCIWADHINNDDLFRVSSMTWTDSGTATYSTNRFDEYDWSLSSWAARAWLGSATGTDQAWTVVDFHGLRDASERCALLFNRATGKWRFCSDLGTSWSATDGACLSFNGQKDQDNVLQRISERVAPTPNEILFVETLSSPTGEQFGAKLWIYNGTTLSAGNVTPAGGRQDAINSDRTIASNMASTPANYPDASTPKGMVFWVTANSFEWANVTEPAGEYVLVQYANFWSGFVRLLDVTGLSFDGLRTLLAEILGYVHYYNHEGTFVFEPRDRTVGTPDFVFDSSAGNLISIKYQTQGWERVRNEIIARPYEIASEPRTSEITKGLSDSVGILDEIRVSPYPGEQSKWLVRFVSATIYDLFKLEGDSASATVAKASAQSINSELRAPTDGAYLSIFPEGFTGTFIRGDTFTFWVFEPNENLTQLDERDRVEVRDTTSQATYQRSSMDVDNRFAERRLLVDLAGKVLAWRKDPHSVVKIEAPFDPAYQPLKTAHLVDPTLALTAADDWMIVGLRHKDRSMSELDLMRL